MCSLNGNENNDVKTIIPSDIANHIAIAILDQIIAIRSFLNRAALLIWHNLSIYNHNLKLPYWPWRNRVTMRTALWVANESFMFHAALHVVFFSVLASATKFNINEPKWHHFPHRWVYVDAIHWQHKTEVHRTSVFWSDFCWPVSSSQIWHMTELWSTIWRG